MLDIERYRFPISFVTRGAIEIVPSPDWPFATPLLIDGVSRERFPTVHDFSERVIRRLKRERVDVGRHHTPSKKLVLEAIEVEEGVLNDIRDPGFC